MPKTLPTALRLLVLVSLVGAVAGCGDGDPSLRVMGELSAQVDGTTTGFRFDQLTKLVDTRFEDAAERVTGQCTMRGPVVIVALGNPAGAQPGIGISEFEARFDADAATVAATLGDELYSADLSDTCAATVLYADEPSGVFGMELDCTVTAPSGATAQLAGELEYHGCTG